MIVPSKILSRLLPSLLFVLPVLVTGGCGQGDTKPRGKVALEITYEGKPVTAGQVNLQSTTNGEGGGGALNADGIAEIPAVVEGTYIVTVTPPIEIIVPQAPGVAPPAPKVYANIPEKYRRMETSTLKAEISSTDNDYAFDLKK